ncbi:hypothetical protein WJX84_005413 [Apatococcus fuscideae]|uniref:Uncharacterized protein n=1 Tax=Apatococcus fuscideae TaxID=2026836 RepID=A0AAW1RMU6_9CHLO
MMLGLEIGLPGVRPLVSLGHSHPAAWKPGRRAAVTTSAKYSWSSGDTASSNSKASPRRILDNVEDASAAGPRAAAETDAFGTDGGSGVWETVDDWTPDEEMAKPDITRLEPAELDLLMPLVPSASQLQIVTGGPTNLLQRCAGSLLGTLVCYKFVLLASASLTFPLWSPVLLAAARNWDVKKSCKFVGLWRTAVMEINVKGRRRVTSLAAPSGRAISLLMGDDSGLRSSINLPYNSQYEQIQVGDAAEMLVTSFRKDFSTFKALKEVYLPETGIWLSDYPLTNRQAFLDVSLAVEDERQQEAALV